MIHFFIRFSQPPMGPHLLLIICAEDEQCCFLSTKYNGGIDIICVYQFILVKWRAAYWP